MGENKRIRFPWGFLRLAVSFLSLAFVACIFRDKLPLVLTSLNNISIILFVASLIVFVGVIACNALRLANFLHFHKIPIPFINVFNSNLLALFVNIFLPSSLGGETVKAFYLHKISGHRNEVFGLVILDRFFGLLCLVALSCTALVLYGPASLPISIRNTIYVMSVIASMVVVFLIHPGIARVIEQVIQTKLLIPLMKYLKVSFSSMQLCQYGFRSLFMALLLSFGAQFFYISNYYLLSISLGIDLPLVFFVFFVPVNIITGLIPSINGLGIREIAYLFYATEYISAEDALALSLLSSSTLILVGCIGGVLYLLIGKCLPEKCSFSD